MPLKCFILSCSGYCLLHTLLFTFKKSTSKTTLFCHYGTLAYFSMNEIISGGKCTYTSLCKKNRIIHLSPSLLERVHVVVKTDLRRHMDSVSLCKHFCCVYSQICCSMAFDSKHWKTFQYTLVGYFHVALKFCILHVCSLFANSYFG